MKSNTTCDYCKEIWDGKVQTWPAAIQEDGWLQEVYAFDDGAVVERYLHIVTSRIARNTTVLKAERIVLATPPSAGAGDWSKDQVLHVSDNPQLGNVPAWLR